MSKATFSKTFRAIEGDAFAAYHAAEEWCHANGYSTGSMQRGAPTMIYAGDCDVAKHRNLSKADLDAAAGKIEGVGGQFRDCNVTVTLWGGDALANLNRRRERPMPIPKLDYEAAEKRDRSRAAVRAFHDDNLINTFRFYGLSIAEMDRAELLGAISFLIARSQLYTVKVQEE